MEHKIRFCQALNTTVLHTEVPKWLPDLPRAFPGREVPASPGAPSSLLVPSQAPKVPEPKVPSAAGMSGGETKPNSHRQGPHRSAEAHGSRNGSQPAGGP